MKTRLVVFCKAPVAGYAKRRLAKKYGVIGAARIARQLLFNTANTISKLDDYNVEFCCAPDSKHPDFLSIKRHYRFKAFQFTRQLGNTLGYRMYHAARRAMSDSSHVILIGTDCPDLSIDYVESAIRALGEGYPVVIGPAHDGGYVLLGLGVNELRIFKNIHWGSSQVLKQTLRACKRLDLAVKLLPSLRDVDYPADWIHWTRSKASG